MSMPLILFGGAGICAVVSGVLVWMGMRKGALRSEMASTQTTPIAQAGAGRRVELKGLPHCNAPLEAPYCKTPCLYYTYTLKQRERERDSDGDTKYRWRTIDSGTNSVPFILADDSGQISVDPNDATFETRKFMEQMIQPGEGMGSGQMQGGAMQALAGAAQMLGSVMGERQKVEVHGVPVNQPLYVLGDVRAGLGGEPMVGKGDEQFLISCRSEEELMRSYGTQVIAFYVGAGVLAAGALGLAGYALVS